MVNKIRITGVATRNNLVRELERRGVTGDILTDLAWYGDRLGEEYTVTKITLHVYHVKADVKYPTVDMGDATFIKDEQAP